MCGGTVGMRIWPRHPRPLPACAPTPTTDSSPCVCPQEDPPFQLGVCRSGRVLPLELAAAPAGAGRPRRHARAALVVSPATPPPPGRRRTQRRRRRCRLGRLAPRRLDRPHGGATPHSPGRRRRRGGDHEGSAAKSS